MTDLARPSNRPRAEIERLARNAITEHGGPAVARVFFKFDCAGCGARLLMTEPGVLPRRARCGACRAWTDVTGGGYRLQQRTAASTDWDAASSLFISRAYTGTVTQALVTEFER